MMPKYYFVKLFMLILVIGGAWFGLLHWDRRHAPVPTIAKKAAPPSTVAAKRPVEDNLHLYADLETLAPSSNLNAKLLGTFKSYPLQTMVGQLDHYISQAAGSKFALTDPSTDMGQFTYTNKKKSRHKRKPVIVHTYSENIDPYNDG